MNMFSTVGHADHSAKKRLLSNVYSKSYIQGSPQMAANSKTLLSQRFLPLLHKLSETRESVNVHEMNNAFAMDFMSAYQFGLANSTNFTQDVEVRRKNLHEYHCRKKYEFYNQEVPWFRDLTALLGMPVVPKFCKVANDYIEVWNSSLCNGADKLLSNVQSPGDEPVVYRQFKSGISRLLGKEQAEQNSALFKAEVASEMLDHLGAGHETSAIALTYLYWEMSKRPDLQSQLRTETLTLDPQIRWPPQDLENFELPHAKDIDALPILHAIVMETLRLHAPIPGTEPRVTPKHGCTLAGYDNIPGGMRVSAMAYTLHRNASVFPDPLTFKPERWLNASEDEMKEMLRWFWAFGSGGRMCIGSNLAMQEMKLIVCSIYSNWKSEIVNDEGIEEIDAYTVRPSRNALDLRFVRV